MQSMRPLKITVVFDPPFRPGIVLVGRGRYLQMEVSDFSKIEVLQGFAHCCPRYPKMEVLGERGARAWVSMQNSS